jgi:hypothetical protein
MALVLVLLEDRRPELGLFVGRPGLAARGHGVAPDRGQHRGRLLAAHDRDARARPDREQARRVGPAAHAVVAGAEAAAQDHGELGYPGRGHRGHHLGAVLGDAPGLVLAADHEPGDVLQEHQRDTALAAELDEVRALERGLREQDAVVGDQADRIAVEPGEAADQGRAVERLELVELAGIDQTRDDLARVVGLLQVGRHDAVELGRVVERVARLGQVQVVALDPVQVADDAPRDGQRVGVVHRHVVGDAGGARVHLRAAQLLGAHLLARRRLYQRRAAQEDRALVLHDHAFVRHGRHVGAAGGTRPHDQGHLRDAGRREGGLVVEDAPEVVAVGKDLVLVRQVGATGIHQVDAGQTVFAGDLLGAQVLLDGEREIGAALHGRVVGDDHALPPGHAADPGDDPGRRDLAAVQSVGGQLGQLEEGRALVEQRAHPFARQQLAARQVLVACQRAAALLDLLDLGLEVRDQRRHGGVVLAELGRTGRDHALEDGHLLRLPFTADSSVPGRRVAKPRPMRQAKSPPRAAPRLVGPGALTLWSRQGKAQPEPPPCSASSGSTTPPGSCTATCSRPPSTAGRFWRSGPAARSGSSTRTIRGSAPSSCAAASPI